MLTGLLSWFSRRRGNRRHYPRRAGGFRAWSAGDSDWKALVPVDISAGGMGVISSVKLDKTEMNFRIAAENKSIAVRAKQVWCTPGTLHGKPVWRYGLQYTGIGADDWDALVRFCSNEAVEIENKAQKELELVRMQADDVVRLIPQRLQERMLAMLVDARRLSALEKDKIPLVQYFYGGPVTHGGKKMHRLSIRSRVIDDAGGETRSYDSRFLFDESGADIEMD